MLTRQVGPLSARIGMVENALSNMLHLLQDYALSPDETRSIRDMIDAPDSRIIEGVPVTLEMRRLLHELFDPFVMPDLAPPSDVLPDSPARTYTTASTGSPEASSEAAGQADVTSSGSGAA